MRRFLCISLLAFTCCASATACPVCDSDSGQQVRAGIFDADFGRTLIAIALPFPILLGMVLAIHFGRPIGGRPPADPRTGDATYDDHDKRRTS